MVEGKADAFIHDAPYNLIAIARPENSQLLALEQPFTYEPLAFGLKKAITTASTGSITFSTRLPRMAPTIACTTNGSRTRIGWRKLIEGHNYLHIWRGLSTCSERSTHAVCAVFVGFFCHIRQQTWARPLCYWASGLASHPEMVQPFAHRPHNKMSSGDLMMKKYLSMLLLGVSALVAVNAAHAGAIDDAVKRGTLKVGMDPTYMPFQMTNKRGEIIGFEVDILKAMAKSMGVKFEPISTGYDGIIPALLTNKFDMIGSGMTLTQERNLRLNFSEPFIVVGQTLLIRKELEGTIKSYKDLNDEKYRLTSKLGTTGEMVAKKLIAKAKYHGYDNEQEAVLDVVNGKADAFVYDAPYNVVAEKKSATASWYSLKNRSPSNPWRSG